MIYVITNGENSPWKNHFTGPSIENALGFTMQIY